MDQIPDYFECIIKKHETIINNSPIQIYINRIKNSVASEIETDYKLDLQSQETMKLLRSMEKK